MKPRAWILPLVTLAAVAWALGRSPRRTWPDPPVLDPPELDPQLLGRPPRGAPPEGHTLSGRVVDGAGQGLSDVLVLARSDTSAHWTRTGADGRFELSGAPQGRLEVTAWLLGFATASRSVDGPQAGLELCLVRPAVEAGSPLPELDGAPLSGLVQACLPDQALPSRHEVLLVPREGPQSVQGAVLEATATDTEGRFTFERVAFGTYDLQVLPEWARGGSWPDLTGEGPLWIEHRPGGTDSASVPLACGAILARLLDDAEDPVEGALVLLHLEGAPGLLWPPATTGPDGRFEFLELPVGNYELEVRAGEGSLLGVRARVEAGRVTQPDLPPIAPRQSQGDEFGRR